MPYHEKPFEPTTAYTEALTALKGMTQRELLMIQTEARRELRDIPQAGIAELSHCTVKEKLAIVSMVQTLTKTLEECEVYLIGSKARGDASAQSDVDLVVLFSEEASEHDQEYLLTESEVLSKKFGVTLSTMMLSSDHYSPSTYNPAPDNPYYWITEALHTDGIELRTTRKALTSAEATILANPDVDFHLSNSFGTLAHKSATNEEALDYVLSNKYCKDAYTPASAIWTRYAKEPFTAHCVTSGAIAWTISSNLRESVRDILTSAAFLHDIGERDGEDGHPQAGACILEGLYSNAVKYLVLTHTDSMELYGHDASYREYQDSLMKVMDSNTFDILPTLQAIIAIADLRSSHLGGVVSYAERRASIAERKDPSLCVTLDKIYNEALTTLGMNEAQLDELLATIK